MKGLTVIIKKWIYGIKTLIFSIGVFGLIAIPALILLDFIKLIRKIFFLDQYKILLKESNVIFDLPRVIFAKILDGVFWIKLQNDSQDKHSEIVYVLILFQAYLLQDFQQNEAK